MLLQEGAHVNKTNKFGQNALTTHVADCLGDDNLTFSEELALMLINAGEVLYVTDPPVEFSNGEHENALYVVSYTEYIEKGKEFEVSYVRVPACLLNNKLCKTVKIQGNHTLSFRTATGVNTAGSAEMHNDDVNTVRSAMNNAENNIQNSP